MKPKQNDHHSVDDIRNYFCVYKYNYISIQISPEFVPEGSIVIKPVVVQIMTWCQSRYVV